MTMPNGYYYNHSYNSTGDSTPTWTEHVLHVGNNINACCNWQKGDVSGISNNRAAFATASGVEIVNLNTHESVAYAALSGGFNSVDRYKDGTNEYLYLGHSTGGVYRLQIVTSGVEQTGDIAPSPWNATYTTVQGLPSNVIYDLMIYQSAGKLAVASGTRLSIITISGGAMVHSYKNYWYGLTGNKILRGHATNKLYISGGGRTYYLPDITTLAADFGVDAFSYGGISDNFDDNSLDETWRYSTITSGGGSYEEAFGRIQLTVSEAGANAYVGRCGAVMSQALNIQTDVSGIPGYVYLHYSKARLIISDENGDGAEISIVTDSLSKYFSAIITKSGGTIASGTQSVGNIATASLKIVHNGANLTCWGYDGSTWYSVASTAAYYATRHQHCIIIHASRSAGSAVQVYNFLQLIENSPPSSRGDLLKSCADDGTPININGGWITEETSGAGTNTVFLARSNSSGARAIDTDETPAGGESESPDIAGDSWEIEGESLTAISTDADASYNSGTSYTGSSGGLKTSDNESGEVVFTHDSAGSTYDDGGGPENRTQPLIYDNMTCLLSGEFDPTGGDNPLPYILYGTSGSGGGGFLHPDSTPPAITAADVQPFEEFKILIGCIASDALDYAYSALHAVYNDAINYVLTSTGWELAGDPVQFTPPYSGGDLAYFDPDSFDGLDGKWAFHWHHYDEAGNPSDPCEASPVYIDEPILSNFSINGGDASTSDRGVILTLDGDSGDDSENEEDAVYEVEFAEALEAWGTYPRQRYGADKNYPFVLSEDYGLHQIKARGYSESGKIGDVTSDTISLIAPVSPVVSSVVTERMIFFHSFESDDGTWTCDNTNEDFPVDNVKDDRLGVIWKADTTEDCYLFCDFGAENPQTIRFAGIYGHNFQTLEVIGDVNVSIGFSNSEVVETFVWANVNAMISADAILWRPNPANGEFSGVGAFRFWAVKITGSDWGAYRPQIGRIIFSETYWRPERNLNENFVIGRKDQSAIIESESGAMVALQKNQYDYLDFSFQIAPETLQDEARAMFKIIGGAMPLVVMIAPARIPYGRKDLVPPLNTPFGELSDEPLCVYGYLEPQLEIQRGPRSYGAVPVRIREIIA